eukprot:g597.t1
MQAARNAIRPMVTRPQGSRNFIDSLVNKPNTVAQDRLPFVDPSKAHLHGADNPTYLKDPNGCGIGDDKTFMLMNAFQIFLLMQLGRGLYNMANGVGKS